MRDSPAQLLALQQAAAGPEQLYKNNGEWQLGSAGAQLISAAPGLAAEASAEKDQLLREKVMLTSGVSLALVLSECMADLQLPSQKNTFWQRLDSGLGRCNSASDSSDFSSCQEMTLDTYLGHMRLYTALGHRWGVHVHQPKQLHFFSLSCAGSATADKNTAYEGYLPATRH